MDYNFSTFKEVKDYFNTNLNELNDDIQKINVNQENFKNLKYVEYGNDYMKFTENGDKGYSEYKWIKIIYDLKKVTNIQYGISGLDSWWDEILD